jgi:hypothetical protein
MKWKMIIDIPEPKLEIGSYFTVNNAIYQIMYDEYKKEYFLILDSGRIIASDYKDLDDMIDELFEDVIMYPVNPIAIKGDTMMFDIYDEEGLRNVDIKHTHEYLDVQEFDIDMIEQIIEELLEDEDDGEIFE